LLNKVLLIGHLGRDPEITATNSGKVVCKFSLAVDGGGKDKTEWVNIQAWEKTAEICGKYLSKGSKAYIEGRLRNEQWEDKEVNKRSKTVVVANRVLLLDSKSSSPQAQRQTQNQGMEEVPIDEDFPF
jgi:single-strand DNA-binding protein